MAVRAGISQAFESEIERGKGNANLETLASLAEAGGCRLVLRIVPGDGVPLRDSGQLSIVRWIIDQCHGRWRHTIEMPIGSPPDRRAADLVVQLPNEVDLIEVERAWVDHQAQYRPLQLKRAALAERLGRPVNLILCLVDNERARRAVGLGSIIEETLPVSSRRIWASLRSGEPVGGDGILWVRPTDLRRHPPEASGGRRLPPAFRRHAATRPGGR